MIGLVASGAEDSIRRFRAAASLKRRRPIRRRPSLPSIRRFRAAASLKPQPDRVPGPRLSVYPPLSGGGLIEAAIFPGFGPAARQYPPLSGGGLIEARQIGAKIPDLRRIRRFRAAASLKQAGGDVEANTMFVSAAFGRRPH